MKNSRKPELPMTLLDVIKNGYLQQVRFLVDRGVDLNQKDSEKKTALMLCAFIEPEVWGVGICRLLIENGAVLYCKDKHGLNAFHYAVIYERVELVRVYLKAIDFDLNDGDKLGNTALHYAVRVDNSSITRLIAQVYLKYQISFDKVNKDGHTPLQEAYRLSKLKSLRILEDVHALSEIHHAETNITLESKTNEYDENSKSCIGSRKSHRSRSISNSFSRQSCRGTLFTRGEYAHINSPTVYMADTNGVENKRRNPFDEIPPNEKNIKKLIRCVSAGDIRNNPEYLFQLPPSELSFLAELEQGAHKRIHWSKVSEIDSEYVLPRCSWRREMTRIYVRYQYQCTSSYRDSATPMENTIETNSLPPFDKSITPATSEHTLDDDTLKKTRNKSGGPHRPNTEDSLPKGKHVLHKSVSRKNSQHAGHSGKMQT